MSFILSDVLAGSLLLFFRVLVNGLVVDQANESIG